MIDLKMKMKSPNRLDIAPLDIMKHKAMSPNVSTLKNKFTFKF